jgi:hypothetical protein
MDLVPILPTYIIHARDTGHRLLFISQPVKHFPLGSCPLSLIISSSFLDLRVGWLLECSLPPPHISCFLLNYML